MRPSAGRCDRRRLQQQHDLCGNERGHRGPLQSLHSQVAAQASYVADSLEEVGERPFAFTRLPPGQWRNVRTIKPIDHSIDFRLLE
jgi:hypothetical protein